MACKVAENRPLERLRESIGAPKVCHSSRPLCVHGLAASEPGKSYGVGGAALGYCQALFARAGRGRAHTESVLSALTSANVPWSRSHEIYWGYRQDEQIAAFLHDTIQPLRGTGRVPIVISALDPALAEGEIRSILGSAPPVRSGETVLLRIVLGSPASFDVAASLIEDQYRISHGKGQQPGIWPLLQSTDDIRAWESLRRRLGRLWSFVNIAINPHTTKRFVMSYSSQVTVAQVPVGDAAGVGSDGVISLPSFMKMAGAGRSYPLFEYAERMALLDVAPTMILLGPSQPDWSIGYNVERISLMVPLLKKVTDQLWRAVPERRRDWLWRLPA